MAGIALQLWTIREECDRDLAHALRRVGALGYDGVELFQLHGHAPADVRALLDAAGLVAVGRHAAIETLEQELPQLAEELDVLGTDRVALGWVDPSWLQEPGAAVARIEAVAVAARAIGLRLGVHNHWSELERRRDGGTFLDLLRALPADLLWLELDLGWIWQAGADPVAELAATHGRCPLVHAKDYASREGADDVPVGDGVVGYERVLPAAVAAGTEWIIVEEDEVGDAPFAAIERSLAGVRRMVAAA